jgi:hypothetical protein
MAMPLSGLQMYLQGAQVEDAAAARNAELALRQQAGGRAERQMENLAAYQRERVAAGDRRAQTLAGLQREQMAARERAVTAAAANRRDPIVQTDAGPMMVDPSGKARPITGADGAQIKPKSLEKALPGSLGGKLLENQQNLRRAEQALSLLEGNNLVDDKGNTVASGDANATGKKGFATMLGDVGNYALNEFDPQGVETRGKIADLGSVVIHDRSGAAVTAAEYPRLAPFIPSARDQPDVARKKLKSFVSVYKDIVEDQTNFFRESGYKVPTEVLKSVNSSPAAAASGLSPAEQKELADLRARLGKR